MQFIYPTHDSRIGLPRHFDGKINEIIVKLAHTRPKAEVYWYLDDVFLGQTTDFHEMALRPEKGEHIVFAVDAEGNEAKVRIQVE